MTQNPVIYALDTLLEQLAKGLEPQKARSEAERIVLAAFGGDRYYLGKTGEVGQNAMSQRDAAIRRDFHRGVHIPVLARRYGISERRAQVIVQPEREKQPPAEPPGAASVQQPSAAACLTGGAQPVEPKRQRTQQRPATPGGAPTT